MHYYFLQCYLNRPTKKSKVQLIYLLLLDQYLFCFLVYDGPLVMGEDLMTFEIGDKIQVKKR